MKKLVFTNIDSNQVTIVSMSNRLIKVMSSGGNGKNISRPEFDREIYLQTQGGIKEQFAVDFSNAKYFGGLVSPEAIETIKNRDWNGVGVAFEYIDIDDFSIRYRPLRNAWRRSKDGGLITIDIPVAKLERFKQIKQTITDKNKELSNNMDTFDQVVSVDLHQIRDKLHKAVSPDDILNIWPEELN